MRKLVVSLTELLARRRLLSHPGVRIARTAKVMCRRVSVRSEKNKLSVGEGSIVEANLIFEREASEIAIGANTFVGSSLIASASRIEIGDDVLISWGCTIVDHNSHSVAWSERNSDVKNWYVGRKDWSHVIIRPVVIGNKSWIGFNVCILKGIQIGEGAVIGAGSVITKDVSAWTLVAGNPAKVIREIPIEDRAPQM
jgi:acetyltransferase-like isoleucine patch superfamily enzyme